ncbi:hypothetical protein ACFSKL_07525 [Belliella marina]|uniref:Lipid A 3-O-deacylase (PagL) n=1 Tax=Belliella marina TaxID=1644146 RepID=A0ABW4VLT5_9BACT
MNLNHFYLTIFFALITLQSYSQTPTEINITEADTIHIVSFKKTFSQHYTGWSVTYKEIKDVLNEFTIPLVYSYGNRSLNETSLKKFELSSLNTISIGLGFNGYEQIMKGFFLNLGLEPNIGVEFSESITNDKSRNFYFSGTTNIGFLWVPSKELGLVIGSSIFGSLSNSKYINKDWGVSIEIGVNF